MLGPNFIPNTDNTGTNISPQVILLDCNGHGTHVAGLIGSASFGAAKRVTLISVKISPCKGGGPISAVLAGIQWVHQDYQQKQTPSVVKYQFILKLTTKSLSLGARVGTFETAIQELIHSGVTVVVAAGNSNADACLISPACVPEAITVAATTIEDIDSNLEDVRSSYSNWGDCVSIFAPGELLESTWWESSTSLKLLSGTSMASPLTAGVVANILSDPQGPKQPYFVKETLLAMSQKGSVDIDCSNTRTPELCNKTPNLFLHVACDSIEKMEL
jgi:subtilisin family serine protease